MTRPVATAFALLFGVCSVLSTVAGLSFSAATQAASCALCAWRACRPDDDVYDRYDSWVDDG